MKYFLLDPLADFGNGDFCFSDKLPAGIGLRWYRLADGTPFGDAYPTNVTLQLGAGNLGLKRGSFVGNTGNMLIVDKPTASVFTSARSGAVEVLPFILLDHKERTHSADYVFLNPLERIACLNEPLSEVRRSKKGVLKEVKRLVLDATKLPALDFFRLGELSSIYLLSASLVDALTAHGATNLALREVAVELRR